MSLNVAGIGPAGIDPQVAALAPSQLAERLCERGEPGLPLGIVRGDIREHADAPRAFDLLRARRERPCRCTAEDADEIAASHVRRTRQPPLAIAQHRATATPMPALLMGRGDSPAVGPSPAYIMRRARTRGGAGKECRGGARLSRRCSRAPPHRAD